MISEETINLSLEMYCRKNSIEALRKRIDRGDFVGHEEAMARAFVSKKMTEALTQYQLSPEYSALRQANAAEQANKLSAEASKKASRAYAMSALAVVVSLVAIVVQLVKP